MGKQSTLHAGALRHRVSFLAQKISVKHGITKERWETIYTCWAAVMPLNGREYFLAAAVNREHNVRFILRHRPGIAPEMTIRFRGSEYIIESIINPDMRNERLEILARSVIPAGDANQH